MFKNKENTLPFHNGTSFFSPMAVKDELFVVQQELINTKNDSVLKRNFIISLIFDVKKLEKVLAFNYVTNYLTPRDIFKIAAAKDECCNLILKAGIYNDNPDIWKKINGIAEVNERMHLQKAP